MNVLGNLQSVPYKRLSAGKVVNIRKVPLTGINYRIGNFSQYFAGYFFVQ
ncbi:hypothetical protein FF011L_24960 [Roseimaritima multifibrata]|uniref:Uncharacterized protein n=1 Tax=Roseimaritima multifibrata TaxID=1930274 RepID=A0A517MFR3_9BACT|nr:hypothetical protein FF011L_24960 [Roseimaritima multifibrata]